jgi:hypothetical protein
MAVPRPVLIALLGLAMLVAVFLATRNSQNESVTPPATQAKPVAPKKSGADKSSRPETRQSSPAEKPEAKPAPRKPKPAETVPPQVRKAAAAVEAGNVVVFFFTKPGAADDTLSRLSVRELERTTKGVSFFKADIADVGAYRPMLSQLQISQVPAVAIVRPGKRAVLLQGYVDAGTLRQNVADAQE